MNDFKTVINKLKKPSTVILVVVVLMSIGFSVLAYRITARPAGPVAIPLTGAVPTLAPTPTPIPTKAAQPIILPPVDPSQIQGLDAGTSDTADRDYAGISWFRISYPTCGLGALTGQKLKDTIQYYHSKGVRVLFVVCQVRNINSVDWDTIAQSYPDAVQCGNEQMKQDASVSFLYMPPAQFAQFYDRCESAIHAINPHAPVLLGSLDPHVAGPDEQLMLGQVDYLNQVQKAMDTLRPRTGWNWHTQALGLIDSWYNGYQGVNNLTGMFEFWAQQFHVDVNKGQLGRHLWVVEGTACYKGCGIGGDATVGAVHVLTLISDTQTSLIAHVPFFHFSGKDFLMPEGIAPLGILDIHGHPKPLRQDQPMGAYKLTLTCGGKQVTVVNQLQLMARMYNRCALPGDYIDTLVN